MTILGISAYYHDSAAALLIDGKVVAASCEERFSRIKHDKNFPKNAILFCLEYAHKNLNDIDYVVFYEKPFIKFERILKSFMLYTPKSIGTFISTIPIWLKERLNLRRTITRELSAITGNKYKKKIQFVEHHLSHAAFSYYTSKYSNAAILVIDAVGETATTSIMEGKNDEIVCIKQQHFPNSLGLLYSAFTYFLGFAVNSDEYKIMGLAPYGNLKDPQTKKFIDIITHDLVEIADDGGIILNTKYFAFMYSIRMIHDKKWEKLFDIKRREEGSSINLTHKNLAAAIQFVTEIIIFKLAKHAKEIIHSDNLCISGGCALNCAAMGKLKNSGLFKNIYIPFAPGDDGAAIGSALAINALSGQKVYDFSPYLGPEYIESKIKKILLNENITFTSYSTEDLLNQVIMLLDKGKIIGWFQSRMEFGPRALGNRSILADARKQNMKDLVNARVKFRESFRPFAPAILEEKAMEFFNERHSPYMMFNCKVFDSKQNVPAIIHIDGSARVQTVSKRENRVFHNLLEAFYKQTGCPVLLNTSFNVMGEPIVCTPIDAIKTFRQSGIDILVINNFIITK